MPKFLLLLSCLFLFQFAFSQDDLLELLNEQVARDAPGIEYTIATFKTTRIVNGISSEIPGKGVMQMIIQHRFGKLNTGWRELFGIDNADMRLGFEYGIMDWLSAGIGRSSVGGNYDLFGKVKFLRQSTGSRRIPITALWYSNIAINSKSQPAELDMVHRVSYAHQLVIARKFTRSLSVQLTPSYIHLNLVQTPDERNDIFSIGLGARYMVSRSVSFNAEYFQLIPGEENGQYAGSISFGIDIETGGHVFQVTLTNSTGMIPQLYIPNNSEYWWDNNIRLGFNINRVFTLVNYEKRKAKKKSKSNSGE